MGGRPTGPGYRHGWKVRQLTTPSGPVALTVPRGRLPHTDGRVTEWRSPLLPRYARRVRQVDAAVLQVYLSGANSRRIRWALKPLLASSGRWPSWIVCLYLDGFHLKL